MKNSLTTQDLSDQESEVSTQLKDMSAEQLDESMKELTTRARNNLGSTQSRIWMTEAFDIEGVHCRLEVELVALCTSLDDPEMPSGWRFRLNTSCEARLAVDGRGEVFSGECAIEIISTDPFGKMHLANGALFISESTDKAWLRLRHHQAFTSLREAAEIEKGVPPAQAKGAPAKRL